MIDAVSEASVIAFQCDVIFLWDCELQHLYDVVAKERFMKNVMVPLVFGIPHVILVLVAIFKSFQLKRVKYE